MARLVRDTVLYDADGSVELRQLRFASLRLRVDVEVQAAAAEGDGGLLLTVLVWPPGVRRLVVRRQVASASLETDENGRLAGLVVPPGPLSILVLGSSPVQTEWLVL